MEIQILPEEVQRAKEEIIKFDAIKTYNKCNSNNNYKGLLGEIVFDRFLTEMNIDHEWVPFMKTGTIQPDFIINGVTYDLKVSTSGDLWLTHTSPHDMYICAQIDDDNKVMKINGWISKEDIITAKLTIAKQVNINNRISYIIKPIFMFTCTILPGLFPLYPGNMVTPTYRRDE